jgi:hypothetical protein
VYYFNRSSSTPTSFFLADAWALLWVIFIGFPEWNGVYTFKCY